MFDSTFLDVLVALVLLYALGSVALARINEAVLAVVSYRGRQLEAALRGLLSAEGCPPAASDAGAAGRPEPSPDLFADLFNGPLLSMRMAAGRTKAPPVGAYEPVASWAKVLSRAPFLRDVCRARELRLPAYVPSTAFANALLDHLDPPSPLVPVPAPAPAAVPAPTPVPDQAPDSAPVPAEEGASAQAVPRFPGAALVQKIVELPASPVRTALTAAVATAADRESAARSLATWYDEAMDRASGWYKRRVQRFIVGYALLVTVLLNLDTVNIATALWRDDTARSAAVAAAAQVDGSGQPGQQGEPAAGGRVEDAARAVRSTLNLTMPIGWALHGDDKAEEAACLARAAGSGPAGSGPAGSGPAGTLPCPTYDPRGLPETASGWASKVLGLLVTWLALTVGGPIWFDLLGRLVNMRNTGPKPKTSREAAAEK